MEIPSCMPKLIGDEANDALKYANLAMEHRGDHPDLADLFMKLSGEELHHLKMIDETLAAMIGKIHAEYKNA